ncbi:hypothetical protein HDE_14082 [Halotydeus destructor]|nr:hypothetical protein HDE_14082 [Halotydeus destructor]
MSSYLVRHLYAKNKKRKAEIMSKRSCPFDRNFAGSEIKRRKPNEDDLEWAAEILSHDEKLRRRIEARLQKRANLFKQLRLEMDDFRHVMTQFFTDSKLDDNFKQHLSMASRMDLCKLGSYLHFAQEHFQRVI